MKQYIVALFVSFFFIAPVKAHFFAFAELYNPKTGQIVEAYFDIHESKNPSINLVQRKALLKRSSRYKKQIIGFAEDSESVQFNLNFKDRSRQNAQHIQEKIAPVICNSPLAALCGHFFLQGIPTCNFECRNFNLESSSDLIDQTIVTKIAEYDDGKVLNNFYASINDFSQELAEWRPTTSFYQNFMVDARGLHIIYANPTKHIFLCAGACHIVTMMKVLFDDGWIIEQFIMPSTLSGQQKQKLKAMLDQTQEEDAAMAQCSYFNNFTNEIYQFALEHAIDIDTLATNPKLANAPRPVILAPRPIF